MSSAIRWCVIVLVAIHAGVHLLGVVNGFGWAGVPQLRVPISRAGALAWLVAAVLVAAAAAAMAAGGRRWWLLAAVAAMASQTVILTAWGDAKVGTAVNVVLLLAAGYGFASAGPAGLESRWRAGAQAALAGTPGSGTVVTEADLARLPGPVAAYVRRSGAVGRPRVTSFAAAIHGRIRSGPDAPWMAFTGRQVNTYGVGPQRFFYIEARMHGLPVAVLHAFDAGGATMLAKVLSLVTVVDAAGPDATRAETVTLFNDLAVLAPAALIDAPVVWSEPDPLDPRRVHGTYTSHGQSIAAELVFDADDRLADFISDDRLRASADGRSFTRQRWSTPITGYRDLGGRHVAVTGEGRWHAPAPEGEFAYVDFHVDDLAYNVRPADARAR
jgi:hypothetical protein